MVGRQTQRANTPPTNAEEYFRCTVLIPLLDHMTTELEAHFGDIQKVQLLCLVPACSVSGFRLAVLEKLQDLVSIYKCDLPAPDLFHIEYVLTCVNVSHDGVMLHYIRLHLALTSMEYCVYLDNNNIRYSIFINHPDTKCCSVYN